MKQNHSNIPPLTKKKSEIFFFSFTKYKLSQDMKVHSTGTYYQEPTKAWKKELEFSIRNCMKP